MVPVPPELRERLQRYGQDHVLAAWDRLSDPERRELLDQLEALDLEGLVRLFEVRDRAFTLPDPARIQPVPVVPLGADDGAARRLGEEALRRGEVAALVVAGGQGSRLGFDHPKGMFPIGPVTHHSLFQVHAEKVLALTRRYGRPVPLLVMTSNATHDETEAFFRDRSSFGLPAEDVQFFRQGEMPALDLESGKLLMVGPGRLFTSPNGHGGTLAGLADSGLLAELCARGVRHLFYFQVDNPLVKVAEPAFLGRHAAANADVSAKVIAKETPLDKMGNFVLVDGRLTVIEYSDLPEALARQTDDEGRLRIWAGNPAIHFFSTDFLTRVTQGARLPFHVARKKVPHVDAQGRSVRPQRENALKFEMFIFDVLPLADRWVLVETSRPEEFVPLKNAEGADSPPVVRQAISNRAAAWLERAGVRVPRRAGGGDTAFALEVSPLFALDAEQLAGKVGPGLLVSGPVYLGEERSGVRGQESEVRSPQ
jgi:UDP-N-acetylglucosamine/UDP-N-acetylgalactosamine diphosphorylase